MPRQQGSEELDAMFRRIAAAQQNLQPHDQVRNDVSLDDALWNGFEKPRGIQKAGLLVYSGMLFVLAIAFIALALDKHDTFMLIVFTPVALGLCTAAIKVGMNAFRPRKKKRLRD